LIVAGIPPEPIQRITTPDGKPIDPRAPLPDKIAIGDLDPDGTGTVLVDMTIDSSGRSRPRSIQYKVDGRLVQPATFFDQPVAVVHDGVKLSLAPGDHKFTAEVVTDLGVPRSLTLDILVRGTARPQETPPSTAFDRPIALHREAVELSLASGPHRFTAEVDNELGVQRTMNRSEAEATAISQSLLGVSLAKQGRYAEAEPLLQASVEVLQSAQGVPPVRVRQALERIVALYEAWGKPAKANAWRLKLLDFDFPADPFTR
jgi:hypothetical protein